MHGCLSYQLNVTGFTPFHLLSFLSPLFSPLLSPPSPIPFDPYSEIKFVLRLLLSFVDHIINRRLRFGYDIGKGFVVAKEEMLNQLDKLGFAHEEVLLELRERSEAARLDVIRSLGLLRKEHPGVAQSVKTHHAMRSVLNHCMDTVKKMLGSGILDQNDADKLFSVSGEREVQGGASVSTGGRGVGEMEWVYVRNACVGTGVEWR